MEASELEVELAFDCARTERVLGATKVRVRNIDVDVGQVGRVEQIEGVGANFNLCAFTQEFHRGQPEGLCGRQVDVRIVRSDERIAGYTGSAREPVGVGGVWPLQAFGLLTTVGVAK